jgi:RNA polymerase sigma-70 factor (ECF subfamily)
MPTQPDRTLDRANDRELVDAVLAGDVEAYRTLVDRESRSVIGLCMGILRDADDAQDVAQDAFVRAYRSLATFRGDGTFGAWIGRIATRMAIARAVAIKQEQTTASARGQDASSYVDHANPEREMLKLENANAVRQAIRDLPADQRQVVELRFYHEMPLDQIASTTGTPLGTVKSRLHRALARLRDQGDLRSAS